MLASQQLNLSISPCFWQLSQKRALRAASAAVGAPAAPARLSAHPNHILRGRMDGQPVPAPRRRCCWSSGGGAAPTAVSRAQPQAELEERTKLSELL
eukprot:COSAG04_NODE_23484_length_337_cov_1.306723_1_plen_96_part_01